jgi:hypothetical protein
MAYTIDLPVGTIIPYAGQYFFLPGKYADAKKEYPDLKNKEYLLGIKNARSLAKGGWLLCDGKQYKVTDPQIGDLTLTFQGCWGLTEDGRWFRVPDMQGVFLRGVANTSLKDPDAIKRTAMYKGGAEKNNVGSYQPDAFANHSHTSGLRTRGAGLDGNGSANLASGANTGIEGGSIETRPKNVYVHYLVKAKQGEIDLDQLYSYNKVKGSKKSSKKKAKKK